MNLRGYERAREVTSLVGDVLIVAKLIACGVVFWFLAAWLLRTIASNKGLMAVAGGLLREAVKTLLGVFG